MKQCRFPTTQECYERPCANCIPSDKPSGWYEQYQIRDEMVAEVAPMLTTLRAAVAGTYTVDAPAADEIDARRWADEMEEIESDWHDQVTELRGGG